MRCDEYLQMERYRRQVTRIALQHLSSGVNRDPRQRLDNPDATAEELRRVDAELNDHLASCGVCSKGQYLLMPT